MRVLISAILFSVLSVTAIGQRAIEPVRVMVSGPADSASAEMVSSVRAELRSLRDVALVESRVDFEIRLNAKQINSGECRGVTAAVLVVRRADSLHALDSYVGGDFQQLAAALVETLNAENFSTFRAQALQRRK